MGEKEGENEKEMEYENVSLKRPKVLASGLTDRVGGAVVCIHYTLLVHTRMQRQLKVTQHVTKPRYILMHFLCRI